MGGTARAALKVWRVLSEGEASRTLTLSQLKELGDLPTHMGLEGIKLLSKLAPQRLTSLLPGVEALRCILEHLEARSWRCFGRASGRDICGRRPEKKGQTRVGLPRGKTKGRTNSQERDFLALPIAFELYGAVATVLVLDNDLTQRITGGGMEDEK